MLPYRRTTASEFLFTLRRSLARAIALRLALQPMPARWKLLTSLFNPNLLMTMAAMEGVEQTTPQLVMRMSIVVGSIWCLVRRALRVVHMMVSTSSRADLLELSSGSWWSPSGKQVVLPIPDRSTSFFWNSMLGPSNAPEMLMCSMYVERGARRESGGR